MCRGPGRQVDRWKGGKVEKGPGPKKPQAKPWRLQLLVCRCQLPLMTMSGLTGINVMQPFMSLEPGQEVAGETVRKIVEKQSSVWLADLQTLRVCILLGYVWHNIPLEFGQVQVFREKLFKTCRAIKCQIKALAFIFRSVVDDISVYQIDFEGLDF